VSGQLRRLVLDFCKSELAVRALYCTKAGPNPGTVACRREVADLAHEGPRHASLERRTVGSIDSRLRRLEDSEAGDRCPACGLTPDEHGRPVAVYPGEPDKGFQGDTGERCGRCGRNLYTVLRVLRDADRGGGLT